MTTISQKRKAVAELVTRDFEVSSTEKNETENYVAGPNKAPKTQSEKRDEIKMSMRKEIMSDLTEILAENQKEMFKVIAPTAKKQVTLQTLENSHSEPENVFLTQLQLQ